MSKQTIPVNPQDALEIRQVGGDLTLQGWDRQELQASGDVVHIEKGDRSISVASGGDLALSVPRGMSVILRSIGGDAKIQNLSGDIELGLVGGDANLNDLTGSIRMAGSIGGDITMQNVARVSMSYAGKGSEFDVGDRIRRKVEQATQRAERKLRRAQVRIHQAEGVRWKYNSASDASPASQPGEPVSEEERMAILRMLQEKKITSEQAEKLLAALEGNA